MDIVRRPGSEERCSCPACQTGSRALFVQVPPELLGWCRPACYTLSTFLETSVVIRMSTIFRQRLSNGLKHHEACQQQRFVGVLGRANRSLQTPQRRQHATVATVSPCDTVLSYLARRICELLEIPGSGSSGNCSQIYPVNGPNFAARGAPAIPRLLQKRAGSARFKAALR